MKILDDKPMSACALDKMRIRNAIAHFGTRFEDYIDGLYSIDDEDSDLPDEMFLKNPYSERQINSCVRVFSDFYVTNKLLDSYDIRKVVSTPDLLYIELVIKVASREFEVKLNHKF